MRYLSPLVLTVLLLALVPAADAQYTLIGWSDFGINWSDSDFSVFAVQPPGGTIVAQLVDSSGKLVRSGANVRITYEAVRDPLGAINTTSAGKINFWTLAQKLFGLAPAADTGLSGSAMPGPDNTPRPMVFDAARNRFLAEAVPAVPFDDNRNAHYYPMFRLVARDASGNLLASTRVVLPVSDEMDCRSCHRSGGVRAATPIDGWVNDLDVDRDYKLNILRRHDDRQSDSAAYKKALGDAGYSPQGLYATATGGQTPVLCVKCHASNLGARSGMSGISALTVAMHGFHASQTDPDTGQRLGDSGERAACYRCHPGPETRFLRGAMGRAVAEDGTPAMHCQSCHGTLGVLAASGRRGWLEEPYCQACHTGTAMNNAGQIRFTNAFAGSSWRRFFFTDYATERDINDGSVVLYRSSRGHGGLQCAACHGATHAESPSAHDNDNLQSVDLQGFAGTLSECGVCHRDGKVYEAGGPHNMHSVGSAWVAVHDSFAERSVEPCRECHGRDLKGTLLSRALADRSIQSKLGTLQVWRGFQIGCATCHLGELDDRPNPNKPPVVSNASAAVASGQSATIALTASDADNNPLTVRIVSQPKGGTVALSRTTATYRANPDFEGADQFTYAAWDGAIDSNLGKVTVTVTAKERPVLTAQGVTNAASFEPGLAPGLLTTIFGSGMGPAVLAPGRFLSGGFMRKELASTRVLFNGVAAPLVYVSGGLLTAVAPYSLAGSTQASVVIEYAGIRSAPVTVPVAPVAPGVFTANATGKGPVLNLSSDPVTPGAAVVLYVTGEGATAPPGVDGKLAVVPLPQPMQPISVRIGGKDAQVLYSGGAPGLVAGVMQLNVVVPPDLSPGTVTLVVLSGTVESQPGVTLEVR